MRKRKKECHSKRIWQCQPWSKSGTRKNSYMHKHFLAEVEKVEIKISTKQKSLVHNTNTLFMHTIFSQILLLKNIYKKTLTDFVTCQEYQTC